MVTVFFLTAFSLWKPLPKAGLILAASASFLHAFLNVPLYLYFGTQAILVSLVIFNLLAMCFVFGPIFELGTFIYPFCKRTAPLEYKTSSLDVISNDHCARDGPAEPQCTLGVKL